MTKASRPKNGELKSRWTVTIIGIPTVLGLLYSGGWILGVPVAFAAWIGATETYRLGEQSDIKPFRILGGTAAAALTLLAVRFPTFTGLAPWAVVIFLGLFVTSAFSAMMWRWPKGKPLSAVSHTLFGAMYVGFALACIPLLHAAPAVYGWGPLMADPRSGLAMVALPLACTWVGDSAAFFAGIKWGRSKILPKISPKKSWVGSWTGLVAAAAAGMLWYLLAQPYLPGLPIRGLATAAGVGVLLGAGAQMGDFFESLLKREAGVKDSGTMFGGHGGMLDRLDALTVTLPLAYALVLVLERWA